MAINTRRDKREKERKGGRPKGRKEKSKWLEPGVEGYMAAALAPCHHFLFGAV